jgi:hypothetical protein
MRQSNPIDKVKAITEAEVSRRSTERESNRANFPALASLSDEVRAVFPNAQFLQGEEGGRVIGKLPPLPANCVWLDWTKPSLFEAAAAMGHDTKRRNGK